MSDSTKVESRFSQSTRSEHFEAMVRYLDGVDQIEGCQQFRRLVSGFIDAHEIRNVLEIGSGTGTQLSELARTYPEKTFTGLDISPQLVELAMQRHGESSNLDFRAGRGEAIPFESGSFDAIICERVLQHCETPADILSEMLRVARKGAHIILCEPDWTSLSVEHPDLATTRQMLDAYCSAIRSPAIGADLETLLKAAGVHSIQHHDILWQLPYPASDKVLGLNRMAELAINSGLNESDVSNWVDEFRNAEVSAALPFHVAIGEAQN